VLLSDKFIDWEFLRDKKKYTFGGQKGENKPSRHKHGFWAQNQYGRVIYPLIKNCMYIKKKHYVTRIKGENKPSEP
jgi:hypothetical protein